MANRVETEGALLPAYEWTVGERLARASRQMSELAVYREYFHGAGKHLLWTLNLLFSGQVHDCKTGDVHRELHLPYRLSAEQRERALGPLAELFHLMSESPQFERTPIGKARDDTAFQRFLAQTTAHPKRRATKRPRS